MEFDYIFGYSRKSPDDKEGTEMSLKNQDELIQEKVREWNGSLTEIYTDRNISGGDRNRKGFTDLLSKVKFLAEQSDFTKKIVIILKDQDRFARDSSYFRDTLKSLEPRGIKVFSILKNNFLDFNDIGDSVMSIVNEQMIIEGKKKANLLMQQKRDKSLPPIPAPYGYKYNSNKEWVLDKRKAEKVKGVVQKYVENAPFRAILSEFKIDKNAYYRIIKNAGRGLYSGFIVYLRKYKDAEGNVIRVEEISYLGTHEKIIGEEIYLKCQKKI